MSCPDDLDRDTGQGVFSVAGYTWADAGAAPVAPPPDPEELARQAYGELPIPNPTIHLGPDPDRLAVQLWTWLWVDDPGQLSKTVTARGLSVTATATLASTTWSLGEPVGDPDGGGSGAATVTCAGPGTAPASGAAGSAPPACGYRFHWRSTPDRTGGSGRWPITATARWEVRWTATNGAGGTLDPPLETTTTTAATVGEYRTVLVDGDH
ncbi:hypothetical protein [Nakamurella endophytica]|uniref:hypothetical protein n=1 Tax=Nakamurella endophytica TaxID=1748367 RepID=UPI001662B83D|nr:hypothetical protein [Nakamurella endophytica]